MTEGDGLGEELDHEPGMEGEANGFVEAELAGEAGGGSVGLEKALLELKIANRRDMSGIGNGWARGIGFRGLLVVGLGG